jgi:hypothetical protein
LGGPADGLLDRGWLPVAGVVPDEDVAAEVAMRIAPHGIDRLRSTVPDRGAGVSHRADTAGVALLTDKPAFIQRIVVVVKSMAATARGLTCRGQMRSAGL